MRTGTFHLERHQSRGIARFGRNGCLMYPLCTVFFCFPSQQCVRTWAKHVLCSRKREPPACSCNGCHSFRNYASSCYNRRYKQQYLHHGKSCTKPYGSELIAKFFSELAMYEPAKRPLKEVYCTNIIVPNAHVVQACPVSCIVKKRAGVKSVLTSCRKENKISGTHDESRVGECSLSSSKRGVESSRECVCEYPGTSSKKSHDSCCKEGGVKKDSNVYEFRFENVKKSRNKHESPVGEKTVQILQRYGTMSCENIPNHKAEDKSKSTSTKEKKINLSCPSDFVTKRTPRNLGSCSLNCSVSPVVQEHFSSIKTSSGPVRVKNTRVTPTVMDVDSSEERKAAYIVPKSQRNTRSSFKRKSCVSTVTENLYPQTKKLGIEAEEIPLMKSSCKEVSKKSINVKRSRSASSSSSSTLNLDKKRKTEMPVGFKKMDHTLNNLNKETNEEYRNVTSRKSTPSWRAKRYPKVSPQLEITSSVSASKRKRSSDSCTILTFDMYGVGAKKRTVQKMNHVANNTNEISSHSSNMLLSYSLFSEIQGTKNLSDLAKLPTFQPIVVLNKIPDKQLERRTIACRERSVSSGRHSSVKHRPNRERKSRRDLFLEGKKMNRQEKSYLSDQSSLVIAKNFSKRCNSEYMLRCSPVITRSQSRGHIPETRGRHVKGRYREISSSPSPEPSRPHKKKRTSRCARSWSRSESREILEKPEEKLVRKGTVCSKNANSCVPSPPKVKRGRSSNKSNPRLSPILTRSRSRSIRSLSRKEKTSCCEVKDISDSAQMDTLDNQGQSSVENPVLSYCNIRKETNDSNSSDFPNTWKKLLAHEAFPLDFNPDNISSSDETDEEINVPEKRLIAVIGSILNKAANSEADEELYDSDEEEEEEEEEEEKEEEEMFINSLSKVHPSRNFGLVPPEETSDTDKSNDSSSTEKTDIYSALLQSSSLSCSSSSASKSSGLKLIKQSSCLPSSKSLLYSSNSEESRLSYQLQCDSQSATCCVPQRISEQPSPFVNTTKETSIEAEHCIDSFNLPIPHSLLTPSTSLNDITPNRSPEESCALFPHLQSALQLATDSDAQQIFEQPKLLVNIPMESSVEAQRGTNSCNLPMSHSLLTPSNSFNDTTSNRLSCDLPCTQSSKYGPLEYSHYKSHSANDLSITSSGSSNIISSKSSGILNKVNNSDKLNKSHCTSRSPDASETINPLPCCLSTCEASLISHGSSGTGPCESPTIRSRLRSRSGSPGACKTSAVRSRLRSRSGSPGASKSSIIHSRLRGRSRSSSASETRNSTGNRKMVSEYSTALWTEIPSEPKHRQVRTVNAISKECRIKALALTARKFVPVSRVASEQRQMILRLQLLRQRQGI